MDSVEIYVDDSGEYRWRRQAPNGEIVAESGEGYTEKHDAIEAAERELDTEATITDTTKE